MPFPSSRYFCSSPDNASLTLFKSEFKTFASFLSSIGSPYMNNSASICACRFFMVVFLDFVNHYIAKLAFLLSFYLPVSQKVKNGKKHYHYFRPRFFTGQFQETLLYCFAATIDKLFYFFLQAYHDGFNLPRFRQEFLERGCQILKSGFKRRNGDARTRIKSRSLA